MPTHLSQESIKADLPVYGPAGLLFVDDGGEGGIPVVFAHSFGGNSADWDYQLAHLRKSRRAIAFDFRSHGRSKHSSDQNFTAEDLAKDIEAVVDGLHLNRFVLAGHSMGGAAAIAYAGAHPERVAGLVLAGTPGKSDPEMAKQIVASLESDQYDTVMKQYMDQLLKHAGTEVLHAVKFNTKKLDKETALKLIRSMFWYNPIPDLNLYKGPKLILSTSREKEQPNSLMHQVSDLPQKTIEGTSHWMQIDKPAEFNKILDEFLNKVV
jgi:pimeloyl-ACP methyl ester carboxylesterase